MYTNETKSSCVKVYPNKDAIKQMALHACRTQNSQKQVTSSETSPHPTEKKQNNEESYDFYTLLLLILLLSDGSKSSDSLFTVILSTLFLT